MPSTTLASLFLSLEPIKNHPLLPRRASIASQPFSCDIFIYGGWSALLPPPLPLPPRVPREGKIERAFCIAMTRHGRAFRRASCHARWRYFRREAGRFLIKKQTGSPSSGLGPEAIARWTPRIFESKLIRGGEHSIGSNSFFFFFSSFFCLFSFFQMDLGIIRRGIIFPMIMEI